MSSRLVVCRVDGFRIGVSYYDSPNITHAKGAFFEGDLVVMTDEIEDALTGLGRHRMMLSTMHGPVWIECESEKYFKVA